MAVAKRAARPAVMLVLLALLGGPVQARPLTVAVMPFRDLATDSRFIGEAIRETVMSDLRQLGGLRVVERASLDQVLAEQKLQKLPELAVSDIVRVGKVLGAQLIVVGAYQNEASVARFAALLRQLAALREAAVQAEQLEREHGAGRSPRPPAAR